MSVAPESSPPDRALSPYTEPGARTLPDLLREQAEAHGEAPAAITAAREIDFAGLHERSARLAAIIRGRGLGRGDRVGVLLGNGIEWVEIAFGASMTGAAIVPFSTWSTRDELSFLIRDSGVRLLFAAPLFGDRDFAADLAAVLEGQDDAPEVVLVAAEGTQGCGTLDAFLAGEARSAGDGPRPEDDALILYTSGSTSAPKGVRLTHGGVIMNGFHIGERMALKPGDRVFLPAPLFWSYGSANALPATFSHGAALVLCEKFAAETALELIERLRCTAVYTLPAMTNALVRHPTFRPEAVASLRTGLTIGSADDFRLAVERLGVSDLCNVYGATETYGNCCVTWHHWPSGRRAVCQGTPLPGQELRIRDRESGRLLPPGEAGLVEVRGCVSPGYTGKSAELNEAAFTDDGFYRTGDVGYLDEDGAFVFVDRDTEMIKRAGINVSPAEVEDALRLHPDVAQCAVTGVPDPERGELIVAYVILESGAQPDAESLRQHCAGRISKYKLPDHIEFCDELPLTPTGKLQRKALKAQAAERLRVAER